MTKVLTETYCEACGATHTFTHDVYRCETCGSVAIHKSKCIDCECGTRVYLDEERNVCQGCGVVYDKQGGYYHE